VTLQPLERYPLDAAILFSDILTVPDAMGLGLSFAEGEGPRFAHPCATRPTWPLAVPDMDKLRYVFDAVTSIRKALNGRVPLIGFSGSPWTLACYMVEGKGSDDYRLVKT
jgi:uroporphyrinogen decarboxylase